MARIENSPVDDITIYPDNAADDIFFNNNVALRNCTVVDVVPGIISGEVYPAGKHVFLANEYDEATPFDFLFNFPDAILFEDAEVNLFFDPVGWSVVKPQILKSSDFKIIKDGVVRINIKDAQLLDVIIPANTKFAVYVGFSFYADAETTGKIYKFDLQQHLSNDVGSYVGGEHFTIIGNERLPFQANAGSDQTINKGSNTNLSAGTVSEDVIYNWYDDNGTLIHTGQNLTVTPAATTTFKLEVIAESDGAKSYDDVQVTVRENFITSVAPNPSATTTVVTYTLESGVTSATLMITGPNSGSKNTTVLDVNQSSVTLNISAFQTGSYTLTLICNGAVMDSKVLIRQ